MSKTKLNSSSQKNNNDRWVYINRMFDELGLVRQHLDSFNSFIEHGLQSVLEEIKIIEPEDSDYYIRLDKIEVEEPTVREADGSQSTIYPMEARIRNLTYASRMFLYMTPIKREAEGEIDTPKEQARVFIGYLPIMLKSKKCSLYNLSKESLIRNGEDPSDPGGYFIINGSERVIVTQEDLAPNRILIEDVSSKGNITSEAKVFSVIHGFRAPVTAEHTADGQLRVSFPSMPRKISLILLMRALGIERDDMIAMAISPTPKLRSRVMSILMREDSDIDSTESALDYIGKRVAVGQTKEYRINRAQQVLDKYLLPHLGSDEKSRIRKAFFLARMAQRLLELEAGIRPKDDKDHYANKRLKLAGDLLLMLYRVAFHALCRDIKYQLERVTVRGKKPNLKTAVRADLITERLRHALATGNWTGGKSGVSQLLDRTNYMSALSHLRRVVSPLSRSQPHFEARDLHPTHYGKICPNETPEGPNCGLVKNLALQAYISVGIDEKVVEQKLIKLLNLVPINYEEMTTPNSQGMDLLKDPQNTKVFLNGRFIGIAKDGWDFRNKLIENRRKGEFHHEVNVSFYEETNELIINCDAGRVRRPLIVVENGVPLTSKIPESKVAKITWSELIQMGVIEYVDAEEEENLLIALDEKGISKETTHMEITTSTILGICASLIPYPEHNRSDRNVYEAGMAKQALGVYAANFKYRVDTRAHILHYAQKPLVKTHGMDAIHFDNRPAGQNFVVAVLSYEGYNMEDALLINKASIERGLGRSTFYRTYEAEERKYPNGQEDTFEVPDDTVRGYKDVSQYVHLGEDGIIEPEIEVDGNRGEVLIGRTSPPRFLEEYTEFDVPPQNRRETSKAMRHGEKGISDMVILTDTNEGNKLVKVRVRSDRIPEIGDKFASRHGQKGVIGLIIPQEDMPFTENGIVPDIIINPHAVPSRMTVGMLMELLAGKAAAQRGKEIYATAFSEVSIKDLEDILETMGLHPLGREVMYDGKSGKKLEGTIFFGSVFYQKLHHLVQDKIHARARGPIQMLTRQPTEGRAREGGLRFGEMERDCLIGHGTSILLKERLLDESDKTEAFICSKCGFLAMHDKNKDRYHCPVCKEETTVSRVIISYAFKLLLQELMSLGIAPHIELEDIA
ncbi:MAG: DNA-directed RNA polymerase subunit B [Candidatus Heimdallarchaeum endolithica]|uniref:DNA-directed RNA polymerase subunit beta n=1 Tax=Candidatus Heimdallarchaeum endolithica TaxID=2876572 RepID=A0A9Y1BPL6_9ARCH|nr:MAG: DNA-directed RNA polymerase subunit B [Candidatus Heimdallarchaeum endolithica]